MELKEQSTAASDDEDDIEKLRLAALQSLKRNVPNETRNISNNVMKPSHIHHKKRNFQGRGGRNGQFYNRHKNTNLISIPIVASVGDCSEITHCNKTTFSECSVPKLTLPQDRYCNVKTNDKPMESSSKFDRYDNSDKSETESECYDESNSESESPTKLVKANSLEALMQELENEIQGDTKSKEEKISRPIKIKKHKQKMSVLESTNENLSEILTENMSKTPEKKKECELDSVKPIEEEKEIKYDTKKCLSKITDCKKITMPKRFHKKYFPDRNMHNSGTFIPYQSYAPPSITYSGDMHFHQNIGLNSILPYNTSLPLNQPVLPINSPSNYSRPIPTGSSFDRPTSPLSLNADDVLTITRAPLSPRSAAFVLQNREIIERRKKSPRRSYSRSPSPRYRRSTSPSIYGRSNRSTSPPRKFIKSKSRSPHPMPLENSRRLSPCMEDLVRDRRVSPLSDRSPPQRKISPARDRRSPLRSKMSPHRPKFIEKRSPNPRRTAIERSPKANYRNSPKGSVRGRLGSRSIKQAVITDTNCLPKGLKRSRSKSLSPEANENKEKSQKNEKDTQDPILEARRKKFETNEIKNTEGIIRLKPKVENNSESDNLSDIITNSNEEIAQEDELVDLLDTKVDDIFSDEETDEENEGRFKSSLSKSQRNVSVLPFTQLLDNSTKNIKTEILKGTKIRDRNCTVDRNRTKQRSRSPLKNKVTRHYKDRSKIAESKNDHGTKKSSTKDKLYSRNKILFKNGSSSRKEKPPVTAPIENKKIEIKIRNPSKYETTSKYDVANEHETLERLEKNERNVEVADIDKESGEENSDSEITNDNEGEVGDNVDTSCNQKCDAGDLRAQLSRKRAERQNKLPIPEDVQSRLLQNALQGAVFKKPKKSRKEKESAPKDGKLPIRFRLGYSGGMDLFQDKVSTKRKRGKSKGRIDQV